jgi:peptide/nickel transport system permease protein
MLHSVLKANKTSLVGLWMLAALFMCAILAPLMAPHNPWEYGQRPFLSPSLLHPLGTNDVGQDIFSELLFGGRVSLLIGFGAALLSVCIGTLVGLVSGFRRGVLGEALMGITDIFLVIPTLPLVILVSVYLGTGVGHVILVIGLVTWPSTARVIRAQTLSICESKYIEAARALGAGEWRQMRWHVLPNLLPIVLAQFVLSVAIAMLMEAGLSLLGLGDPISKSWGMMLRYAFARGGFMNGLWWWYMPPGLAIALCVLALNLISLGVEERSDPRLKRVL